MSEILRRLIEAYGPSANEELVADIIEEEIKPYVDNITRDKIGNLIALKKGKGGSRKVFISVPMDQNCFLSTHIESNGNIKFSMLSGTNVLEIINSNVLYENNITGVINLEESEAEISPSNLYINIGESNSEEVIKKLPIGSSAVLRGVYYENDSIIMASALDTRAACMCLIEVIKKLVTDVNSDLYFVFSCQSKLGARGAQIAAQCISPDMALSIDTSSTKLGNIEIGCGPVLRLRDKNMVSNHNLISSIRNVAYKNNIYLQEQVAINEISDVDGVVQAGIDAEAASIAIPIKNYETSSEIISKNDMEIIESLLLNYLKEL